MHEPENDNNRDPGGGLSRSAFMRRIVMISGGIAAGVGGLGDVARALAAGASARAAAAGVWLGNVKTAKPNQWFTYTDPKSGDPAVLIRLANGQFVSYDAVCTHAGCTVPYDPTRKLMVCPCHGARYDPARGAAVVGGPAPHALTRLPVSVDPAGNVYALDARAAKGPRTNRLKPGATTAVTGGDDGNEGNDDGGTARRRRKGGGDN